MCEHSSSPTMCNESNSEVWQGKWINELTCSNLLCSFLHCTHTGSSIFNCYVLACYCVSSTCENELTQSLHSTRSHNKIMFVWKVVSCHGIVLEETNCTVYWKKYKIYDFFCYSTELNVLKWTACRWLVLYAVKVKL